MQYSVKMLIPKKTRVEIYTALFKDGVMVAKKEFNAPKHNELENVSNLMVIKAMQSLKSRGYVHEQFAWRHFYWYEELKYRPGWVLCSCIAYFYMIVVLRNACMLTL